MNCFAVCSGSKDIFLKAGVAGVVGVADVVNVKGFNVEGGAVVLVDVDEPNPEELARVVRLVLLLTVTFFLLDFGPNAAFSVDTSYEFGSALKSKSIS